MIPRLKPAFGLRELAAALVPWGAGGVKRFEESFADLMGQRHAVAFPYGRTGLSLLLGSQDWEGGEVICPAYTCVVVAHAISKAGFEPVFIDSRESDFNMDLSLVEEAITDRTRAIIPTSIFGHPVDLDELDEIRRRHPDLLVIQDCAHSYAASWRGRAVQSAGDAALFGLNISKIISSIFGGMVTTDDDRLAERLRASRANALQAPRATKSLRRLLYLAAVVPAFNAVCYGIVNRLERVGVLDRFSKYYDESAIQMPDDWLQALTPLEARVGLVQVSRYDAVIAHRRSVAEHYRRSLADLDTVVLPPHEPGMTASHFVVRMDQAQAVRELARTRGVELGHVIEYVVPAMSAYRASRFVDRGVARKFPGRVLNLPVHVGVSDRNRAIVAEVIRTAAGTSGRSAQCERICG